MPAFKSRYEYIEHIRDESILSPNARYLVYTLLTYYNHKTGKCYPSQETLTKATFLTLKTVRKSIKEIEAAGLVAIKKIRLPHHKHFTTFYSFPFNAYYQKPPPLKKANEVSNDKSFLGGTTVSFLGGTTVSFLGGTTVGTTGGAFTPKHIEPPNGNLSPLAEAICPHSDGSGWDEELLARK